MTGKLDKLKLLYNRLFPANYGWFGDFPSWEIARKKCSGYDSRVILEKAKAAARAVRSGQAAFERDTVLFERIEYSWPLLSALQHVALTNSGMLNVLDFGGSLGSSYYQNKGFLDMLRSVRWNVVEQESFVQAGREEFENEALHFYHSIDEVIKARGNPMIAIIPCTLPYIENPYQALDKISSTGIPYLLIDNTYFSDEKTDRIAVQRVPPSIYQASYPCHILSYKKIIDYTKQYYDIISEHDNHARIIYRNNFLKYRGFFARLRN